ncbi:hypothetical protein C0992_004118 [Termitomyces sp. T32_za158]|nr:hypothetical protein C0992_004118 [Termitomyces sp. T32_za158]
MLLATRVGLFMIRTWALWDRSRKIGLFLITLLTITVAVGTVVISIWAKELQPFHIPLNLGACRCCRSNESLPISRNFILDASQSIQTPA